MTIIFFLLTSSALQVSEFQSFQVFYWQSCVSLRGVATRFMHMMPQRWQRGQVTVHERQCARRPRKVKMTTHLSLSHWFHRLASKAAPFKKNDADHRLLQLFLRSPGRAQKVKKYSSNKNTTQTANQFLIGSEGPRVYLAISPAVYKTVSLRSLSCAQAVWSVCLIPEITSSPTSWSLLYFDRTAGNTLLQEKKGPENATNGKWIPISTRCSKSLGAVISGFAVMLAIADRVPVPVATPRRSLIWPWPVTTCLRCDVKT